MYQPANLVTRQGGARGVRSPRCLCVKSVDQSPNKSSVLRQSDHRKGGQMDGCVDYARLRFESLLQVLVHFP